MLGIIGKKLGMTQIYAQDSSVVPVTVIEIQPNYVLSVKTKDKHGYSAVQLASFDQKEQRLSKADLGNFKKANTKVCRESKEFRTDRASDYKVGMVIDIKEFVAGEKIDVTGTSKGKGFQGVMKRHHFAGGRDSHGCSVSHRVPGSIGQRTYPGKVIKGKKMPGQMGNATSTIQNLEIAAVEADRNLILVKGAVPGFKSSTVYIYLHSSEFENKILNAISAPSDAA